MRHFGHGVGHLQYERQYEIVEPEGESEEGVIESEEEWESDGGNAVSEGEASDDRDDRNEDSEDLDSDNESFASF